MPQIIDQLNALMAGNIYSLLLVFARVGTALLMMPGLGDNYTPARVRLLFAISLCLVVAPVVKSALPPEPEDAIKLFAIVGKEIVIGIFLGTISRIMMGTMQTAGMFIAQEIGLSNAYIFSPQTTSQDSVPGTLLGMAAIVLMFATDLYQVLLTALVDSYHVFRFTQPIAVGDMSDSISKLVSKSFLIAVEMSGPFFVVGLVLFVSIGLLARLMPQIQIFFITMPLQVGLGLLVFALVAPVMLRFWMAAYEASLMSMGIGG